MVPQAVLATAVVVAVLVALRPLILAALAVAVAAEAVVTVEPLQHKLQAG